MTSAMRRNPLTLLALCCCLTACGSSSSRSAGDGNGAPRSSRPPDGSILVADFQFKRWPLTVSQGSVRCENGSGGLGDVVFRDATGRDYAVNGAAQTHTSYPPIDEIWKDGPSGTKVPMDRLISLGLKQC